MAPEATLPPSDVNVPSDYFSLAGFELTTHGRFWVLCRVADYAERMNRRWFSGQTVDGAA